MKNKTLKLFGVVLALSALVIQSFATLTATVTPGYVFGPTEIPSIASLNELGEPSITIAGTVDGTTGLTPGSVNGSLLANSVVDGITLDYNSASPRAIQVAPGGISTNQINVSLFNGGGVVGGSGQYVMLWIDTNYFFLGTNSFANTNSVAPTNGVPTTNNTLMPFPWLSLTTNCIVDTNINANAGIEVTKLQNGGTNGVLVSTPQTTNVWARQGLAFVMNSAAMYFTNVLTNLTLVGTNISGQPIYSTNFLTNVTAQVAWTQNLQQVQTNILLNATTAGFGTAPTSYLIPHFFGELPTSVHAWLQPLGTFVITSNVVGSVTNYMTNAPSVGPALDWKDVYYKSGTTASFLNNSILSPLNPTYWNGTTTYPVFTWTADTNYVYVTQNVFATTGYPGNPDGVNWQFYTNSSSGTWTGSWLTLTNYLLNVTIRY
jgi:hypothetical protein